MLSSNQTIKIKFENERIKFKMRRGQNIFENDDLGKFSNTLRKKYSIGDGRILRQAQYERIKRVTADRRIIVDGKV